MKRNCNTQKLIPAHFVDASILAPTDAITVNLIGTGGTGSQVLTALARINHALISLGKPGIFVRAFDSDTVSDSNLGRQLFASGEIGQYKAVALMQRINRFFGTGWLAIPERYQASLFSGSSEQQYATITISCVDEVPARFEIAKILTQAAYGYGRHKPLYWMDFGNTRYSGQVLLSTVAEIKQPKSKIYQPCAGLPLLTTEYKDLLLSAAQSDNTPSCSLAQALAAQDLFINSTLAQAGCSLLWQLLNEGVLTNRGFFLNLRNFLCQPVAITLPDVRAKPKRKAA